MVKQDKPTALQALFALRMASKSSTEVYLSIIGVSPINLAAVAKNA